MARGLWRWWETKDGADIWWARVETNPGQWTDIEAAAYDASGLQPAFWDLPLEEDYVDATLRDPIRDAEMQVEREVVQPLVVALILAGCVLFTVYVLGVVVLTRLGIIGG